MGCESHLNAVTAMTVFSLLFPLFNRDGGPVIAQPDLFRAVRGAEHKADAIGPRMAHHALGHGAEKHPPDEEQQLQKEAGETHGGQNHTPRGAED